VLYFPPKRLTIQEAIRAYTEDAAYAEFAEKTKGKLLPGYVADFVVLDSRHHQGSASRDFAN